MLRSGLTGTYQLLAAVYVLALVGGVVGWIAEPRAGLQAGLNSDGELAVQRLYPGGAAWEAGVELGDVLVEIDGASVDYALWAKQGDRATEFVVRRPLTNELLRGTTNEPGQYGLLLVASFILIASVFALSSVVIFSRAGRPLEILLLALFLIMVAIAFAAAPAVGQWNPLAQATSNLTIPWAVALMFGFFSVFPAPIWRRYRALLALPILVIVGTVLLNVSYIVSVIFLPVVFEVFSIALFLHLSMGLTGSLLLIGTSYWVERSPVRREQLRIVVMGMALAVTPFLFLSLLPRVVGVSFIVRPELTVLGTVLIPLSFVYAILRHHLMGIRRLVHRGVTYIAISTGVLVSFGSLLIVVRLLAGDEVASNSMLQTILLALLLLGIPAISGTRRLTFATVDLLLYRDSTDYAETIRNVSLKAASTESFPELAVFVLEALAKEFDLVFAAIVRLDVAGNQVVASTGNFPSHLVLELSNVQKEWNDQIEAPMKFKSKTTGETLILAALPEEGTAYRVMCFGPKMSEAPMSKQELNTIQSIAAHMGTIAEKLALLDHLKESTISLRNLNRRLLSAQEEERRRIAEYLHGEPLQVATYLAWQAELQNLPEDLKSLLSSLADELRGFTALLRPSVLEDLGIVAAIEGLKNEFNSREGFVVELSFSGLAHESRFDSEVELALYRICQEALRNAVKHANTTSASVHLEAHNDALILTVADEGVGMNYPAPNGNGVHLGIVSMQERTEQLGGTLKIMSSVQSQGTTVVVTLPAASLKREVQREKSELR